MRTLIIVLVLCFVIIAPENAFADIRVTVYVAGGFVIGGVYVFISIMLGDRHHSKNEEKKEDKENSLAEKYALNTKSKQFTEEDINQAGMVKILEW